MNTQPAEPYFNHPGNVAEAGSPCPYRRRAEARRAGLVLTGAMRRTNPERWGRERWGRGKSEARGPGGSAPDLFSQWLEHSLAGHHGLVITIGLNKRSFVSKYEWEGHGPAGCKGRGR